MGWYFGMSENTYEYGIIWPTPSQILTHRWYNACLGWRFLIILLCRKKTAPMRKVLFLCTGNSCRSQMAEGWARHLKGDQIEPYSAGIEAHGLNPDAVRVMTEAGVDISGQSSKLVNEFRGVEFDCVVTVCDNAHESCPMFAGKTKVIHVGFDDPPRLTANAKTESERLAMYCRVRDEIRAFVETLPDALDQYQQLTRSSNVDHSLIES